MLNRLREMLYESLEEHAERDKLSMGSVEAVHMITDTIKNIDKIEMLEESGYSHEGAYSRNGSYSREGGYSREGESYEGGQSGRHYVRGHYSRDGGSYRRGRYSRDDGKQHMMQKAEELMRYAEDDQQKEAIRRMIDQLGRD